MIDGVHFYNFNKMEEKYYAIKTCSKCDNCKRGGYTTVTKNIKWTNCKKRVTFNSPLRYTLHDLDGSLTGKDNCGWVTPYRPHNLVKPHCEDRRWDYGGIVCDCNVKVKKVYFTSMSPA